MVKTKHFVLALSILIMGLSAAFLFLPSEEKKVKKRFALLSEHVSKEPGENAFIMANKIKAISALFGENCDFTVSDYSFLGNYTREEISGIAFRGRGHFSNLRLRFYDVKVSFPEKDLAQVNLTARLTGRSVYGEQVDETRELICLLKRVEKEWLFSSFEVSEVLKK
ncbi:MAG: hypothetical protein ACUVWO_11785 [Thermodesulfobacteriota bacterium]